MPLFKPGDTSLSQLLLVTHETYKSFDNGREVRSVFLDISTAFDKVWKEGLIFILEQHVNSADSLNILRNVLSNRKQRVVLNGQVSTWTSVNAGDPQRSISGPFFAFFYINGLSDMLVSIVKLFVKTHLCFLLFVILTYLQENWMKT